MPITLTAAADDDGRRLDRILRKALAELPLSAIHRLLRQGRVSVNGERAGADRRVRTGESIMVDVEEELLRSARKHTGKEASALEIVFEGEGLLVLNKPAGLVVHGPDSLEEQVRSYLEPKLPASLSFRPGPLHRLDKSSSGLIAFSTSLKGARLFSSLMRERKIRKFYLALLEGRIEREEIWEDELVSEKRAKTALSRVRTLAFNTVGNLAVGNTVGNTCYTLALVEIETGRTHQIRAQAAKRGHPLAGDRKYGGSRSTVGRTAIGSSTVSNFLLHAWRLEFQMEIPQESSSDLLPHWPRSLEAPLPQRFQGKIFELFGNDFRLPDSKCSL